MRLSELDPTDPRLRRWLHGMQSFPPLGDYASVARLRQLACRLADRVSEVSSAAVLDPLDRLRREDQPFIRVEPGENPALSRRSIAIFVHYCPTGAVTDMVCRQVEAYGRLGFAVVLVSNSPRFQEHDWQAARRVAALVIHRRNRGLDFGAWKDVVPLARARWPRTEELLLANDSVLGPIRDLAPIFDMLRSAGPGFFGLVESAQGGPHLQSWFSLARGAKTIGDLTAFLARLRLSRSKWNIVQRGELMLARSMREAGNRVAAVYGYRDLVRMALHDPEHFAYLANIVPHLVAGRDLETAERMLLRHPLNPAHHMWRVLTGRAGCPFIKTELVRRNPRNLPSVEHWADLVPPDSPCPPEMLRAHLAALGP